MNKPLPYLKTRVVILVLLVPYAVHLAHNNDRMFAALAAVSFVILLWGLLAERKAARYQFLLESLSEGARTTLGLIRVSSGKLKQGTLYPTLQSMEREGLVVSYEGPPVTQRGNRPRRYYLVTRKGNAWLERNGK